MILVATWADLKPTTLFIVILGRKKSFKNEPPGASKTRFSLGVFAKSEIFAISRKIAKLRPKSHPRGSQKGPKVDPRAPPEG